MKFIDKVKEIIKKLGQTIKEKKFRYISFFWIIISIQYVIGSNLQTKGHSISNLTEFWISLLKIILFSIIFIILHYCILELFKKCKRKEKVKIEKESKIEKYKEIIYFLIIIICWIPALLAFYPVILNYDGPTQIYMYVTDKITHHTVISTFLIGFCYRIGLQINNTQLGMLIYSIIQMTVMASAFSYAVRFIEKKTNKKWIRNISILFYALFPLNQLFPIMTTKDTLFAGFFLIFIVNLYKIIEEKNKIIDYIGIVILAVIMLLFRKNAIYALVVLIPFIIFVFFKNKEIMKKLLIVVLIIIVSYKGTNKILLSFDAKGGTGEIYDTIMTAQAFARIYKEKENELTQEEREQMEYYCTDLEKMKSSYKTNLADKAMSFMNYKNIRKDKKEFVKFTIKLALKYPGTFIDAFLDTVRGYWYIDDTSFNTIYTDGKRGCLEITFSKVFQKDELAVKQNSYLPGLKTFYQNLVAKNYYTKVPVLYMLFQPATYLYILLACLLYAMYKKQKVNLIAQIYVMLYFLTCFLAPCAIIRYMYGVIVSIPIVIGVTVKNVTEKDRKE